MYFLFAGSEEVVENEIPEIEISEDKINLKYSYNF